MRRDSRIGMAIGGVLVAVLLVYAVVVPKNNKKKVTLDTTGIQAQATSDSDISAAGGGSVSQPNISTANLPTPASDPGATKTSKTEKPESHIYPDREGDSAPASGNNASGTKWAELLAADHVDGFTPSGDTAKRETTDEVSSNTDTALKPNVINVAKPNTSATTQPSSNLSASTHRVAAGETFSSIAQAYYGDSKYAGKIAKANPNVDARRLRPGMTIHLPGKGDAVETASTDSGATTHAKHGLVKVVADSTKEYVVRSGDNLYKISMRLYGRGDKADSIYQLNKEQMGSDAGRLKVGMVLKLPQPPTSSASARE